MSELTWQTCAGAEYPFKDDRVTLTQDGTQVIDRVTGAELVDGDVILSTANARGDWGPGKFRIGHDAWTLTKTERLVPAGTELVRADSREAEAARLLGEHEALMYLPDGVAPDDYDGRDYWACSCDHNYGIHQAGDDVDQLVRAHEAAMLAAAGLLAEEDLGTELLTREREDMLRDLHARYHDEFGNLLGRDECGWQGCEFWDSAEHVVEQLAKAELLTEGPRDA